ncbi:apolipoprotein D-like [Ptychodera flava]|uniref:apolipoprotein D-like n=1 Tax=Ptychodera flava TaxID=63121 RepID=UPI00396A8958
MASAILSSCLLVFFLTYFADGQKYGFGRCKKIGVKEDFDLDQYLGTWYEIQKIPAGFERGLKCGTAHYELKSNGHIKVWNRGIKVSSNAANDDVVGDADTPNPNQPAKLKVKFSRWQPRGNYWVVDTDYTSYAVVYSCTSFFGLVRMEYAWVLARERQPDEDTRAAIQTVLDRMKSAGIDTSNLVYADQTGCEALDSK